MGKKKPTSVDPRTLGDWEEASAVPIGWLFSYWLSIHQPPSYPYDSLHYCPQKTERRKEKAKKGKTLIADFAVTAKSADVSRSFISGEVKYSKTSPLTLLSDAIKKQLNVEIENLAKERTRKEKTAVDVHLLAHNVLIVASPKMKSSDLTKAIDRLRENGLKNVTTVSHLREGEHGAFGALVKCTHRYRVGPGKQHTTTWWVFLVHYTMLARTFSTVVGQDIRAGDRPESADSKMLCANLITPWANIIHEQLVDIFGAFPDEEGVELDLIQQKIADGNTELSSPSVHSVLTDPWTALCKHYVQHCYSQCIQDDEIEPDWRRLLYDAVGIRQQSNRDEPGKAWIRRTLLPMMLPIGIQDSDEGLDQSVIWDLAQGQAGLEVATLVGPSGSGKTTLLKFLHWAWQESVVYGGNMAGATELPLLIRLRDFVVADKSPDETEYQYALRLLGVPASHLSTALSHAPLCLLVDGYDQIADNQNAKDKLKEAGSLLGKHGCNVRRVLVTSRPGFRVESAFDWAELLGRPATEVKLRELHLGPPSEVEVDRFVTSWINYYFEERLRANEEPGHSYSTEGFRDWLKQVTKPADDNPFALTGKHIEQSPLLLSVALRLYIAKIWRKGRSDFITVAGLYRAVIEEAFISRPRERESDFEGIQHFLGELGFRHLANPELPLGGMASGDSVRWKYKRRFSSTTVGDILKDRSSSDQRTWTYLSQQPYLICSDSNGDKSLRFVHPSFQEFLAADFLIRRYWESGKIPSLLGPEEILEAECEGVLSQQGNLIVEIILRLGRSGFRFLLGGLLEQARGTDDEPTVQNRISTFFSAFFDQFAAQQYLYDANYLDEAAGELIELKKLFPDDTNDPQLETAAIVINKWIAHIYYGHDSPKYHASGSSQLAYLLLKLKSKRSTTAKWYSLFAIDHIQNRIDIREEGGEQKRSSYIEDFCKRLNDKNMTEADSWSNVGVSRKEFVLRAAHFWGHLGNQMVSKDEPDKWRAGCDSYSRAILLRVISLAYTDKESFFELVKTEAIADLRENAFFQKLEERKHITTEMIEGFVGKSQAYGDIGQQYCGRASLRLNLATDVWSSTGKRRKELKAAKHDAVSAHTLWNLAIRPDETDAHGGLKYMMYLCLLDVKMRIISDVQKAGLRTLKSYTQLLQDEMSAIEKTIGFHYRISRKIPRLLELFYLQVTNKCRTS